MYNLKEAFDSIRAEEPIKQATVFYLRSELMKRRSNSSRIDRRLGGGISFRSNTVRFAVAVMFVFIVGAGSYRVYNEPTAYLSIDVNPSIELGVNVMDRVVSVTAFNVDGQQIVEELPLKNKNYEDAVDILIGSEQMQGYMGNDALLSMTVQSKEESHTEEILTTLQHCAGEHHIQKQIRWNTAEEYERELAHQNGMSTGKYKSVMELCSMDKTITLASGKDMSIRELENRIEACHGEGMGTKNGHCKHHDYE